MSNELIPSDVALLDLLRKHETMKIAHLAQAMEVTATAVRQRLNRLIGQGYVEGFVDRGVSGENGAAEGNISGKKGKPGRGRPSNRYRLTAKGRRKTGTNFADLALALWDEIRTVSDAEVRRGLLRRLAERMAGQYASRVHGETLEDRMNALAEIFQERRIPFSVESEGNQLPILTADACPYPELAEKDRGVCALERMMFAELLQSDLRLSKCRLDGGNCCTFEISAK